MQRSDRANGVAGIRASWLAYVLACGSLAFAGFFPVNNPDTFGHLAQGRQIVELGHVPLRDTFSFWKSEPATWNNYEWLSDLVAYRIFAHFGYDGLLFGKCALLALSAALLCAYAQALGGRRALWLCALLVALAIPGVRFRLTERPHLVAVPFSVLYLFGFGYLLRAFGRANPLRDRLVIASFGFVHALWVNLHGSHLLGLMLTLVHVGFALFVPGRRSVFLALLALELAASCVSPFGPAILGDAIAHVVDPAYRALVSEWEGWQPTDPLWLLIAPFLQSCLLVFAVRPLARHGPVGRALLVSCCVLALAAFRSVRFADAYLLLSAPAIAIGYGDAFAMAPLRRFAGFVGASLVALLAIVPAICARLPPFEAPGHGMQSTGLPAASGAFLAARVTRPRVLAAIEDSWYLMFAVPGARFLVDGRVPFYGAAHIEYVRRAFADPQRLDEVLERYAVDTVVVRYSFRPQQAMLNALRAHPGWRMVAIEDRYCVFVREALALRAHPELPALALEPSYESAWLLQATPQRERAIRAAVAGLPKHPNRDGYRDFVYAFFALRPLLRSGGGNGIRPPANPAEVEQLRTIERWLARAAAGAESVPALHAYHALAAAALCKLDTADRALEDARFEGESRETLLGAQEVALRRGQREEVETFLRQAARLPGAASDAWLAALEAGVRAPPRCPR